MLPIVPLAPTFPRYRWAIGVGLIALLAMPGRAPGQLPTGPVILDPTRLPTSGSAEGTVRLWDPTGGAAPRTPGRDQTGVEVYDRFLAVAFSPDGKALVTGSVRGLVTLWDADGPRVRLASVG